MWTTVLETRMRHFVAGNTDCRRRSPALVCREQGLSSVVILNIGTTLFDPVVDRTGELPSSDRNMSFSIAPEFQWGIFTRSVLGSHIHYIAVVSSDIVQVKRSSGTGPHARFPEKSEDEMLERGVLELLYVREDGTCSFWLNRGVPSLLVLVRLRNPD